MKLSKAQVAIIWPGLNYIICQKLTREQSGQSITCYPFAIRPLPPGSDSGTFSAAMMNRITQLWTKVQPIKTTGGDVCLGEFELRAAIYSARTSVKLERHKLRTASKKGTDAKRRQASAKRDLERHSLQKERVVEFLETALKRASRLLKSIISPEQFKIESKEWKSHLKWIEFRLTYFKPLPRPGAGRFASADKIRIMHQRFGSQLQDDKHALEHGLSIGRGGAWLNLNEEQYRRLRRAER